jgi:hypothetical protein
MALASIEVGRVTADENGSLNLPSQRRPLPTEAGAGFSCDFCYAAAGKAERRQLVWRTGLGNRVVLAELCGRCAADHDRLLEKYGGRGRESMTVEEASTLAAPWAAPLGRAGRAVSRAAIYLTIALAFFMIVTFLSSRS